MLVDTAGQIKLSNAAAQELLGYSDIALRKLDLTTLIPSLSQFELLTLTDKGSSQLEQLSTTSDHAFLVTGNDRKELKVNIRLHRIAASHADYLLASLYITDRRKQAEEDLRVSEERLQLARQAADLGVFDFDATHNIGHWDEKMRSLWGAELPEDVSSKKFLTVIHPQDRAARQAALDRAINPAGNGEFKIEYRVINPVDASEHWVAAVGRMHFENGHAARLIGVARDITEQKTLEKKLQIHRAETETLLAQQVATQTASAIAHELNQPLAAISAYSEVALHAFQLESTHDSQLKRALEGCVEQAQRAGRSLHELIAFLQKGDLVKERVNLNDLVKEAVNIAKSNGYGDFKPELQLEENLPAVMGNKIQIQKILVNLLRNAVEAMRSINTLTSPITVTVRTNTEIKMAHVTVKDNGPGLSSEVATRIFEPFFTTKPTGIGMGLAISRALTEANGGKLWLESDNGSGAAFHFTLPFAS